MAAPTTQSVNIKWKPAQGDNTNNFLYKILATLSTGLGMGGSDYFADTASHTAPAPGWAIIHAITDTVFASVTYKPGFPHTGSLAGVTLKAGDRIYGEFTAFQLTSGSVEAYRATI